MPLNFKKQNKAKTFIHIERESINKARAEKRGTEGNSGLWLTVVSPVRGLSTT